MSEVRYLVGDVFERMAGIPDGSIDLVVTSPPFLALRSYLPADHPDKHLEIGSEPTPAAYLSTLLALTKEWRRLLTPHGSIAVELGDTYSGSGGAGGDYGPDGMRGGQEKFKGSALADRKNKVLREDGNRLQQGPGWPLAKSLCGIPDAYALSLEYGWNMLNPTETCPRWRVRNKIVWHRPNPPVGALGDKVRPSTSYITTACFSGSRWFDLDAERGPNAAGTKIDVTPKPPKAGWNNSRQDGGSGPFPPHEAGAPPLDAWFDTSDTDVWTIPTAPYRESHYATFPPALPRRLINLMCPRSVCTVCGEPRRRIVEREEPPGREQQRERRSLAAINGNGLNYPSGLPAGAIISESWSDCGHDNYRRGRVLDPFAGSGTTLQAAAELGRDSIGIDLDSRNLELARQRCGLFLIEDEVVA